MTRGLRAAKRVCAGCRMNAPSCGTGLVKTLTMSILEDGPGVAKTAPRKSRRILGEEELPDHGGGVAAVNTLRRIAGWLAPYRTSMVLALVADHAGRAVQPARAAPGAGADRPGGNPGPVGRLAALRGGAAAWSSPSQAGLALGNGLLIGRIGQGVVRDLRHRLYDRLQRLSPGLLRQDPQRGDPVAADGRRRGDPGLRDQPDVHDPDRPGDDRGDLGPAAGARLAAGRGGAAASPRSSRSTSATS